MDELRDAENGKSFDTVDEDIKILKLLMPDIFTDGKIDFDKFKARFGGDIENNEERYEFTWNGKREAKVAATKRTSGTLRPCVEESVNFDTTQHAFIEGDNLQVLKILLGSYRGEVKVIYIDPTYNTGKEFVYPDDYKDGLKNYLQLTGQIDSEGKKLVANAKTDGRYHTNWLNMMYSRLMLAKELLTDDGVIFISISDKELSNLIKVCDEVFGQENFMANIIWRKRNGAPNDKIIGATHDYVLLYCKNIDAVDLNWRARTREQRDRYRNPDDHPKKDWAPSDLMANIKGGRYVESLYFPIVNPNTGESHYPTSGNWRFNKGEINKLLKDKEIYFGDDGKGRPILKRFLCDVKEGVSRPTIWDHVGYNSSASKSIQDLLGKNVFDTPKPLTLMREIVSFASSKDDIILDFFAGSATLAQAVLELNREENMRLRFIMVQLPEPTYDIVDGKKVGKEGSSAFTAGYETVAEIGKERIRRVIEEIGDDFPDYNGDLGFKVFKLATSNMISWDETCEHGSTLEYENIKADRSDLDIMYELILKPKFDRIAAGLTAKIEEIQIGGCKISVIDDGVLVLCLSHNITLDVIEGIVKLKEKYGDLSIIFRDSGFASDTVKQRARLMLKDAGITRVKTV